MHRRVSQRAVYWRHVIHLRTLKASGISPWYSGQTNRLQTIGSKRRNSVFGALGSIRMRESNLTPWAMFDSRIRIDPRAPKTRSEEHTSELQSHSDLVCRLLLEKK